MSDRSVMEFRRVVSGHDAAGVSTAVVDEQVTPQLSITPDYHLCDLWETQLTDVDPATSFISIDRDYRLSDHAGEILFKKAIWPPQAELDAYFETHGGGVADLGEKLSLSEIPTPVPNMLMHETKTIDFITIISGEITCMYEDGEVTLRPGDTLIQRQANHGWVNRTSEPCVMTCVMISALPLQEVGR